MGTLFTCEELFTLLRTEFGERLFVPLVAWMSASRRIRVASAHATHPTSTMRCGMTCLELSWASLWPRGRRGEGEAAVIISVF